MAEQLATEAAGYVAARRREVFAPGSPADEVVTAKSTPTDPVTIVDTETEALLRRRIADLRPGDAVLGEEGGGPARSESRAGVTWVVDPVDGTVNFVYGIPAYTVSVAAQIDGVSVAGAVADVSTGEVYSAALGGGARVQGGDGGRRLSCSGATDLAMTLLGTGFGYTPAAPGVADALRDALDRCGGLDALAG